MTTVHVALYLYSEDETADVEWGVEVFDSRDKAIDGVCTFLKNNGYSDVELAFERNVFSRRNYTLATSLGAMIHILSTEVQ